VYYNDVEQPYPDAKVVEEELSMIVVACWHYLFPNKGASINGEMVNAKLESNNEMLKTSVLLI
jgi:hypothetical protein